MHSSKKISNIVLLLSLIAAVSFLTIVSINGVNFQSEQNQIDYDLSSKIQFKVDGGGGGVPSQIILFKVDIQLPDINGTDICRELRNLKKFKKTPIIAVTSFAMKGDKERILDAGFNDYISKPLRISIFREKIQNIIDMN